MGFFKAEVSLGAGWRSGIYSHTHWLGVGACRSEPARPWAF